MELDQLESKLKSFNRHHIDFLKNKPDNENINVDYSEEDVKDFLSSPLKLEGMSPIKKCPNKEDTTTSTSF